METKNQDTVIYACSGASDLGELTDRAARKLREKGIGKMSCLAALGAGSASYVETAEKNLRNIVIDGCPVGCAATVFKRLGIGNEYHLLTDMGYIKGKTPVTESEVQAVAGKIAEGKISSKKDRQAGSSAGKCGCGNN